MSTQDRQCDRIYKDTWDRRECNLNGTTYEEYLQSEHWQTIKAKALRRKKYRRCTFCPNTKVQLHHKDYKWINTPYELRSIIPVCDSHHRMIHRFAKLFQL